VVRVLRLVGATALAAALLGYVFPRILGTTVGDVRSAFGALSVRDGVILAALWAGGLLVHSFVLTGALPGLTRRRALTLNLTGSAVANVLPFGGAAGVSTNYVMVRAWGIEPAGFAAFTLVTNLLLVLFKLALPTVALVALWSLGGPVSTAMRWSALTSASALAVVTALGAAALASRPLAERTARVAAAGVDRVARLLRRDPPTPTLAAGIVASRDIVASVLSRRWAQLSAGTVGYGLLQAVLLWACLDAVGVRLSPVVVLAAYAVDRVMTFAVFTPGATGFAEAGTAATLIALGGSAAPVAAGVLLYRGFTFALEIPVGGLILAGWVALRRWRRAVP
jgi:uncharacterized membrane protein YbhN (UPF0104 family)